MKHIIVQMPINQHTLQWATTSYPELILQKYAQQRNDYLLLSRALLQEILKHRFEINGLLKIDYLEHGKPYLVDHPTVKFNITHTDHNMAIIVALNAPIGIDIETIKERGNLKGLIKRTLKVNEIEWLNQQSNHLPSFFKLWSAKEAYLKATGTGLIGLSGLMVDLENNLARGPIKKGYLYLKDNPTTESFAFYYPSKIAPNVYLFDGESFSRQHYEWQMITCRTS